MPWPHRTLGAEVAGKPWFRRKRWLSSLLIVAFAVLCAVLSGPPIDLSARLDTRRSWIRELNAAERDLHGALRTQDFSDLGNALRASDRRLHRVADGLEQDGVPGSSPLAREVATTRDRIAAALAQTRASPAALNGRRVDVVDVLGCFDAIILALRQDTVPMSRRLSAAQTRLQFMVGGALLLAVFTLSLLYWHARIRRRVAELSARRIRDARQFDERRLESLSLLAGGLAHDFNNLLVGIIGNADLARESLAVGMPGRENIDDIGSSAARCAELSRKMLAYSGRGRQRFRPVNVNALVEEILEEMGPLLGPRDTVERDLTPDLQRVWADVDGIGNAVRFVLQNAIEALDAGGGTISIKTAMCSSELSEGGRGARRAAKFNDNCVCIVVADDGCGMDEHTLARVFDPFFTTKTKTENRGVDLSVAFGIAQAHRGSLTAQSEEGRGTTIRMTLPTAGWPVSGAGAELSIDGSKGLATG